VGFTEVRSGSADDLLCALVAEEDKLGDLWMQGLLTGAVSHGARERNRFPSFPNLIDGIETSTSPQPQTTNT